jgi:PQQ-dependent catabolism-associated beta-propeller protein
MVHWIDVPTLKAMDATPVGQRPRHAVFSRDGATLWVSSEIGGDVSVIDVASRKVVETIEFAIKGVAADRIQPVGIVLTRDGRFAFVALGPSDRVAVVDVATRKVVNMILVGRRVWHLALTSDETRLLATNGVSGDVSVVDLATQRAIKSIKVGRFPWGAAVRPRPEPVATGSAR